MRESKIKVCREDGIIAVVVKNTLYVQAYPLFNSEILFLEHQDGTKIIHIYKNSIRNNFTLKGIRPRAIVTNKGALIPEESHKELQGILESEFGIKCFSEEEFNVLIPEEKFKYVKDRWKLSHTLAYKLME